MINNKWFCEPNPYRETYCFLYIDTNWTKDHSIITGWKAGFGNIEKIVNEKVCTLKVEKKLVAELLTIFYICKKKNLILISEKKDIMPTLRNRIIQLKIKDAYLSTVEIVSIEQVLDTYFYYNKKNSLSSWIKFFSLDDKDASEPEMMRRIFAKIISLIPMEAMP